MIDLSNYPRARRLNEMFERMRILASSKEEQETPETKKVTVPEQEQEDKQGNIEQAFLVRQANTRIISLQEELAEQSRKANAKIEHLIELNRVVTEEKEALKTDFDKFKVEHRLLLIAALHSGIDFADDAARNNSIESFTKSNISIEDVAKHCDNVRSFQNLKSNSKSNSVQETKLPQRSVEKDSFIV